MDEVKRVYFDSNAFISLLEESGEAQILLKEVFSKLTASKTSRLVTSALTLSEVLVKPFRTGKSEIALVFETWLAPDSAIEVAEIDRDILRLSALLRAKRQGLKTPDAIHLASALKRGCTRLVTADRYFHSIDRLDPIVDGLSNIHPLLVIHPDIPTLTSLLQSLAP